MLTKPKLSRFPQDLFLAPRLFWSVGGVVCFLTLGYFFPVLVVPGRLVLLALVAALVVDFRLLFPGGQRGVGQSILEVERVMPKRLSNGDENPIGMSITSRYPFPATVSVHDELPHQFQAREYVRSAKVARGRPARLTTVLRPVERGEYDFGLINAYVSSPLGLAQRRFRLGRSLVVPVFPSFVQMRKYAVMAISDRLTEVGVKKIRRLGHTMEFDQIRSYVRGDDVRTVNWKATARSRKLMVNQYRDERAQQIVSIIDMGRVMKMPFEGMSLLDHAINSALAVANVSIIKEDKAGLITFSNRVHSVIKPSRSNDQLHRILETLYRQETDFSESSFEALAGAVLRTLSHRSLLMIYTNFESVSGLRRQIPYLRAMARRHLLLVVFFENTELHELLDSRKDTLEGVYVKTVAEQFAREKREIVHELKHHGIGSILTPPEGLTVNAINAYLQLKAGRRI